MHNIRLEKIEKLALEKLFGQGFCAYIVGGGVRDRLMGKTPLDTDITTSATPQQVKQVFCDHKVIETGIKHGTVTVLIEGVPVEITTFRTDGEYKDNRHPESVEYTKNIKDDLSRRDFTINAIAYNEDGLVDLFGGMEDINKKIIRCVGDPKKRFCEDALRIMRGVRFAATLGFEIEPNTAAAMRECVHLLKHVSAERIFIELKKLLCGKAAARVLCEYSFVITQIIPELADCVGFLQHNPHHAYDVYTHTARVVEATPAVEHLRLAALLHDIAKPKSFTLDDKGVGHFKGHAALGERMARGVLERLKTDRLTRERVCLLIAHHNDEICDDKGQITRLLRKIGQDAFFELLSLRDADNSAKAEGEKSNLAITEKMRATALQIIQEQDCIDIKQLEIDGDEIMALGVPKGEQVGKMLEALLEEVISKRICNEKAALTDYVKATLAGKENGKM